MSAPVIQSVGPPPERHADRVVAEMTRWKATPLVILNRVVPPYPATGKRVYGLLLAASELREVNGASMGGNP
jgi:hypothetical protein